MTDQLTEREVLNKQYVEGQTVVITDSNIQVPVDVQGATIQVPIDIQGQAIDIKVIASYSESSASVTGIDAEITYLDLDVRNYKNFGIILDNVGANSLDYEILGYFLYSGSLTETVVAYTAIASGATAIQKLDVSKYSRIVIKAKADTSGSPSDLNAEYNLKA